MPEDVEENNRAFWDAVQDMLSPRKRFDRWRASAGFYRARAIFFYIAGPALVGAWALGWLSQGVLIAITLFISFFTQGASDTTTYRTLDRD